jgi:dipeptidyl-peptidase-4
MANLLLFHIGRKGGSVRRLVELKQMLRLGLLAALLSAVGLFAQKKPVTIDAVVETRRPEAPGSPVWAPDGQAFAYRQGESIRLYDIREKRDRTLFDLEPLRKAARPNPPRERFDWVNRRVHAQQIQWFPNGKDLVVASGGDLFVWHVESGKFDQITHTDAAEDDAKLSPDGARVAFRRNHDLYVLDIASKKETRLTSNGSESLRNGELDWVYPEELELGSAYWWSPDSKQIAYLQFDVSREPLYPHADLLGSPPVFEPQRYPQAGEPNADVRIGIVPAGGGQTRWLDTGDTRDLYLIARVWWMPDSRRLVIERLTRVQNRLDLLSAVAVTGAASAILTETDPYWINFTGDLKFLNGGREFLWSSERDGFRHLYVYSSDGKEVRRLTRGEWEVRGVAGIDEKSGVVYYLSSESSPTETQLYRVGLNGAGRTRITRESGSHAISMPENAAWYLDTYSSIETPTRRVIHAPDGAEHAVFRDADKVADEYDLRPVQILKVKAADGRTELYARLIKPAGFDPARKYPAVVIVYGGPGAQSVRNEWHSVTWEQALAHRGFVVWQVDNRGSAGRGHAFESVLYRNMGPTELADQKAGVEQLIEMGFVDPNRIAIYGWSYGGFMALNAALNEPDLFRAAIAGAPVTNMANYDTIYTERYLGLPASNPDAYKKTNLAIAAAKLKAHLMLVHNFEDDNVLFQNMLQITNALQNAGKQFQLMIYPQKTHGVMGPVRKQMLESMTTFLEAKLKLDSRGETTTPGGR